MQHAFREMGDFLRQTLFFGWIFAGIRLLFRQPAEHIFHRRGRSLRVGIRGILHRVANLRKGKDHDQHHQQRTDEPDSDMLPELRVIPHNRQQENAQRYGQRKVMNARHRRCDQLLDIRGRGQIDRRIPDPDTGIDCCCKYHQNTRQLSKTLLIRSHEFF